MCFPCSFRHPVCVSWGVLVLLAFCFWCRGSFMVPALELYMRASVWTLFRIRSEFFINAGSARGPISNSRMPATPDPDTSNNALLLGADQSPTLVWLG